LRLDPGPAMIRQNALLLGPGGEVSEFAKSYAVNDQDALEDLSLAPLETVEVDLGSYRAMHIGGALALRESFHLSVASGGLREEGEVYPAQDWPAASATHVRLASFLPNGCVEPSELIGHLEDGAMGMPALVERAVRIAPARYSEALAGMRPVVASATPEVFRRLEPLLRWLCPHEVPPKGLEAWREHLANQELGDSEMGFSLPR
ncbi:MAG: hypothetical protein KDB61_11485, partial [Planctomycetes bacterium]|nr:hypothetical protein [Planctomycetota bacterium]